MGYGLAAGCQVFYRKIYGFFYSVRAYAYQNYMWVRRSYSIYKYMTIESVRTVLFIFNFLWNEYTKVEKREVYFW